MISFPSAQQSLKLLPSMTSQLTLLSKKFSLRLIFTVLDSHCDPTFLMWRMNLWVIILLIEPMWYERVLLITTSGDILMDRQTLYSNPLGHLVVFTLNPNRGDHSSLLIRRLRTTNTKGSRCNNRRRTKEQKRPFKLMLLREKVSYMKSSWMKLC